MMNNLLTKYFKDRSANAGIIFALAAVPLIGCAGAAVDYSRATSASAALQALLDSAVLAGMSVSAREKQLGKDQVAVAEATLSAYLGDKPVLSSFTLQDGVLSGTATMPVESFVMHMFGMGELTASAKSAATADPLRGSVCFMAMHPSRKHTLELKDSVSVFAPDCHIYGNSNDVDDVVDPHTSNNFLTGKTVQAIGYGHHYIQNVKPPLQYALEYVPDPLATMSIPSCTVTNKKIVNQTVTLSPGVYCQGLQISNNANVTLSPGTYFIRGGAFLVSKSTVVGDGVTIVSWSTTTPLDWSSSTVRLSAPKSGSLAGIVITGERNASTSTLTDSTVDLHGVIYLPKSAFTWTNSGTPDITAKWTSWIVDGISWLGNGTIKINFDPDNSSIPYPTAMKNVVPRVGPGSVRLIK
jgi:hypothetical protein